MRERGADILLLQKGEIGRFPLGSNGTEKYDVVYLGGLFENYMDSDVYEWIVNDYVFIFSTRLNISKDSDVYGHVKIDLIRHDQFSYFHEYLRDKANYFVVQKEPIIINEFLEVIPEETEHGLQVIAHLKNQITSKEKIKKNYFVLLMKTNDGRLNNLPRLELGPEFQAKIEHDKAMEHYYKLSDCSSILSTLANGKKGNTAYRDAFETVIDSLDKEIEYAKKEIDRAFNKYSSYRRSLEYVYK